MPSTYSPDLRIELIGPGEQAGTWNTTTNTNLGTLIEDAISGYISVSVTSANQALSASNGAVDQARNATVALSTTTGANFAVYTPPTPKQYLIHNTSAFTATIYNSTVLGNTTAAGLGAAVPAGAKVAIFSDGFNFRLTDTTGFFGVLPVVNGGTGVTTSTGTGATVRNTSPTLTGAPLAPTAAPGTNTTQVATTAFVAAGIGALGTMSTQNAVSVAITGGSVTGITDITVADGGTGASGADGARTNLGLVIGTNVLAPNGNGTSLTNLNASALASGTVPATRSGSLRLIPRVNVYAAGTSQGGVVTLSLSPAQFEGTTPSYVMYSASARITGRTDLRVFFMCSGTADALANIVLGSASDDTDESGTARGDAASTFVLPYSASQQFITFLTGATLYIYAVGYQV